MKYGFIFTIAGDKLHYQGIVCFKLVPKVSRALIIGYTNIFLLNHYFKYYFLTLLYLLNYIYKIHYYLKLSNTNTGEGNGTPLQYSCLENPMGRGAWWAAVHGVAKSWTRLSDFTFIFHFHSLEKAMATHSSVLAWRIPGMGEPGGLLSMGSHRVRHD